MPRRARADRVDLRGPEDRLPVVVSFECHWERLRGRPHESIGLRHPPGRQTLAKHLEEVAVSDEALCSEFGSYASLTLDEGWRGRSWL